MINLLRYNIVLMGLVLSCATSAQNLQDPTRPKIAIESKVAHSNSETAKQQLTLQSVFIKESGYLAVVSGEMVKLGSLVQGYRVKKITPNSITLEQGQVTKILRLYQHEIKQ